MSKAGSNVVLFPKLRRVEQTGLTQKGFPARWLGLLLMTSVGAAWAFNPTVDDSALSLAERNVNQVVFEGEPQVVAQLMGAVVGPGATPQTQLRSLSGFGGGERRVVVAGEVGSAEGVRADYKEASFRRAVEEIEGGLAVDGGYPPIPSSEVRLGKAGYRTSGDNFELSGSGGLQYDSAVGYKASSKEAVKEDGAYKVAGFLQAVTQGWGPFSRVKQTYSTAAGNKDESLGWLAQAPVTPSWSARMYFPVSRESTGYLFRGLDGQSAYRSGECLYDGVSGTFQIKLYRKVPVESPPLSARKLEGELSALSPGCEMAGDARLLESLGFYKAKTEPGQVVHLSNSRAMTMSSTTALDGLTLAAYATHAKDLKAAEFAAGPQDQVSASVVGRVNLEDKLGQVHEMRVRAGRATDYDWIVGQMCPLSETPKVAESKAYDNAFQESTTRTVVAGK